MAEAIIRRHKRRVDRWLPKEQKRITREQWRALGMGLARCIPAYLLSNADVLGIPSGLHAAYGMALAAVGMDVRPAVAGGAGAIILRLLSGLPPRWEMLLTLLCIACAPLVVNGRSIYILTGWTALSLLPTGLAASLSPTAAEMLRGWAAVGIAALSAPVMVRALRTLKTDRHFAPMEERVAVGYLAMMCLCGGARILMLGLNTGALLASCLTLGMSLTLGVGAGTITGLLAGVAMALQGLPLVISVALAMGGFLSGVANSLSKRRISCGFFAAGCYLPLILYGLNGFGCGTAVLAGAVVMGVLPRDAIERMQQLLRRFLPNDPSPGDAYAASALHAWEQTIAAMARTVPQPGEDGLSRDGDWWQERLCQDCPECEGCGCMTTELGISKAEAVWKYRCADEQIWQGALEHLRGMGCKRLYHLLEAMNALRREDEMSRQMIRQAQMRRDMLVTHLTAMSGAARRFAALSSGESWWDHMAARRIRRELAERAVPASLAYVRRVQGHAQAAYELQFITGARKQSEELCALTSVVLDAPMQVASVDGDRVLLTEIPLLRAEIGTAAEGVGNGAVCGDTTWSGMLQDGRCLVGLADGMGHGERAALSSRQTVELLRLCLDAGYTRQQTLTAVNGMMLLGGCGEQFATADVLTIDLWKGQAALDKLGAAASWIWHDGQLNRITGDALPLGIIEDIDLCGSTVHLEAGDAVVLLTDGVEDAFRSVNALESAILTALTCDRAQSAAESLLAAAIEADEGRRRDDQSAVVVFIRAQGRTGLALHADESAV